MSAKDFCSFRRRIRYRMGELLDAAPGAPVSDPAGLQMKPETRRIGDRRSAVPVESRAVSRSSLFSKVSFHKNYSQGFWIWRGDQSEHVGAMLLDLCKVLFSIVSRTIANHRADNLQPTMSQAAQSARVA